jgi:predicted phosphodiesterase
MRIGILADIHGAVDSLEGALAEFRRCQVDVVVSLGDSCDTFSPAGRSSEVVALLQKARAIGVWGNHDVGLCFQVSEKMRKATDPAVLDYMKSMQPQLVLGECRFSHVEPWLDARKVEDLWYLDGPPDTPEKASRSFAAAPERCLFVGHFHRWLVMTSTGQVPWDAQEPLTLLKSLRYLIVVAPVVRGWSAIFDTETSLLSPFRCN